MTTTKIATLTPSGREEVMQQVTEITGKLWASYEEQFRELEEHASLLKTFSARSMAVCEVKPRYTVSGRTAFIYIDLDLFTFEEIELDVGVEG